MYAPFVVQQKHAHITYCGELSHVIEGPQGVQLLQGQDECLGRGRVHEVKVNEVIDSQTLEQQHNVA